MKCWPHATLPRFPESDALFLRAADIRDLSGSRFGARSKRIAALAVLRDIRLHVQSTPRQVKVPDIHRARKKARRIPGSVCGSEVAQAMLPAHLPFALTADERAGIAREDFKNGRAYSSSEARALSADLATKRRPIA